MAKTDRLSSSDREFFQLVSRATFSNPFSAERDELDRRIAGSVGGGSQDAIQGRMIERVRERVAKLEEEGNAHLAKYAGAERDLVHNLFLFEAFHRLRERFDRLIQDQIEAGEHLCPVPFGREAIGLLRRRGFPVEEARRYFAFFYQLRRAFFFINRGLVGQSRSMKELRLHLWNNVFTYNIGWFGDYFWNRMEDFSTLLLGETGTGKGTAAAAIGRSGFIPFDEKSGCFAESFARNFISINLSQYPETLIESELFGHRKGAFTGAIEHHDGVFSRCTPHGSIFLDEVGDISVPVQIKLLQVLQERTFSQVGSHEKLVFRGRVIAATNKPLDELRRGGHLRDDFYYRLCSDVVVVPPLRQRLSEDPGELDRLVAHLVVRMTGEDAPEIVATVRAAIQKNLDRDYPWPGNVRELEQAVRRILVTRSYRGDLGGIAPDLKGKILAAVDAGSMDAQELLWAYCALLYERHGTYEAVARRTKLDRRTAKKYVLAGRGD
jgi:transcriptional regulator with AAA-type ATPase domain